MAIVIMQNHNSYRPQTSVKCIFDIRELQMCKGHQVANQLLIELCDLAVLVVLNAQRHYLKKNKTKPNPNPTPK